VEAVAVGFGLYLLFPAENKYYLILTPTVPRAVRVGKLCLTNPVLPIFNPVTPIGSTMAPRGSKAAKVASPPTTEELPPPPPLPSEDRISALPDAVLQHALGFLPAQDAVRTCVLGQRWSCALSLSISTSLLISRAAECWRICRSHPATWTSAR
jgi:hypothetical protein